MREAERLGISVKTVTGDAVPRAQSLAEQIKLRVTQAQIHAAATSAVLLAQGH